ncbi:hypothetical protein B0H13DRAFT_1870441 [Mycena leptocephala]|nr:hypothetical protein B0H13DRAFT_1870441 [Mycena leptocephala]
MAVGLGVGAGQVERGHRAWAAPRRSSVAIGSSAMFGMHEKDAIEVSRSSSEEAGSIDGQSSVTDGRSVGSDHRTVSQHIDARLRIQFSKKQSMSTTIQMTSPLFHKYNTGMPITGSDAGSGPEHSHPFASVNSPDFLVATCYWHAN